MSRQLCRSRGVRAKALALVAVAAAFVPEAALAAQQQPDDGPDIVRLALITAGSIGGAALAGLVLYFIRLRIGFCPHRPPPRDAQEGEDDGH